MTPEDAPVIPNEQVSAHWPPGELQPYGFSDRDNFIRNLVTMLPPGARSGFWPPQNPPPCESMTVAQSPSAKSRTPVIDLPTVKLWLKIETDQTEEDAQLQMLEMAARLYTEDYIRATLDADAAEGVGENIKIAMLLLIAHWYRNREAVGEGRILQMPLGYEALLSAERDYPCMY